MAIKFTSTGMDAQFVKALIYGPSGVGKTTLIKTAPKPIIISSEKKLLALKDENIPVILIENHTDLLQAYNFITTNKKAKGFQTVAIDSVSDIAETVLSHFKANPVDGNTHPQAAYGHLIDEIIPLIKKFRDIQDKHIYVIAKAKMLEDAFTNVNLWMPSMPGRVLGPGLPYEFDFVFAMRIGTDSDGKEFRYLQTKGDIQWLAKGNDNLLPAEVADLSVIFRKALKKKKKEVPEETHYENNEATEQSDDQAEEVTA